MKYGMTVAEALLIFISLSLPVAAGLPYYMAKHEAAVVQAASAAKKASN